jgi:hypothetical protein
MLLPFNLEMDFAFAYLALKFALSDKIIFQSSIQSLVVISRFFTRVGGDGGLMWSLYRVAQDTNYWFYLFIYYFYLFIYFYLSEKDTNALGSHVRLDKRILGRGKRLKGVAMTFMHKCT